jgi:hypothetical protein
MFEKFTSATNYVIVSHLGRWSKIKVTGYSWYTAENNQDEYPVPIPNPSIPAEHTWLTGVDNVTRGKPHSLPLELD